MQVKQTSHLGDAVLLMLSALVVCGVAPRATTECFGPVHRLLRSLVTLTRSADNDAGIATVKLERPEAKNALSREMLDALHQRTIDCANDRDIRCVLLASSTAGTFCAGADLKERLHMTIDEAAETVQKIRSVLDAVARLPMPTIAVVDGVALGGGAELALACDLRIGGPSARFAFPETRLGILPGAGGTQRLPRLVGLSKAKELIFTGRPLDAALALEIGLLNRLADDPMAEALQTAREICEGGPVGIQMAKAAIDTGFGKEMSEALEVESRCYAQTLTTEDRREGLLAFREKRKPRYKGR